MTEPPAELEALLEALCASSVDCIVVGGVAAVLHGAPTTTFDLDVVHDRSAANVERLESLLDALEARVRDPAGRDLRPERAALVSDGQLQLTTRLGPLDLLGTLHDGRGFPELLPHTTVLRDRDLAVRVLDLQTLIDVKSHTGRARDRLLVPLLLALAEESRQEGD